MSKLAKMVLLISCFIVLSIATLIYVTFSGLPWKKYTVGHEIVAYLEKKYDQSFEIEERYYNFKEGNYHIKVHPVKNPTISFSAGEERGTQSYTDEYPEEVWAMQAEMDFKDMIQELFPNLRRYHISSVYGQGMELVVEPPIKNYKETEASIGILINIPQQFEGTDEEFEKMYHLIQYIKDNGGNIELFIAYEPDENNARRTVYANFTNDEMREINRLEDVKIYYDNVE